ESRARTEQIRRIRSIREIRIQAVLALLSASVRALVRACPEERKRRGIRPRLRCCSEGRFLARRRGVDSRQRALAFGNPRLVVLSHFSAARKAEPLPPWPASPKKALALGRQPLVVFR